MPYINFLDKTPLWLLFIIATLLFSIAAGLGFRLGKHEYDRLEKEKEQGPQITTILGASLSLLAFFLAFTFNMAVSRYDVRKSLVVEEANTVETAFLRAGLLPAPYNSEIQTLLHEYVKVRANLTEGIKMKAVRQIIFQSEELHKQLWSKSVELANNSAYSGITGLFIKSLNEVFVLHGKRVNAGMRNRIPVSIFLTLYFVACLSMAMMGYQAGLTGKRTSVASFVLIITFSVVLSLITDLDRPRQEIFSVSQQSMLDLKTKLDRSH